MRLLTACNLMNYYGKVGQDDTPGSIWWYPVIKNFSEQWGNIINFSKGNDPRVPEISETLSMIKWTKAFTEFLHRKIGVWIILLAYVTREVVQVPPAAPPLLNHQPHSNEHGLLEGKLVSRELHNHPVFQEDNSKVHYYLEEVTQTTSYSS